MLACMAIGWGQPGSHRVHTVCIWQRYTNMIPMSHLRVIAVLNITCSKVHGLHDMEQQPLAQAAAEALMTVV